MLLKASEALTKDVGRGIARLDPEDMKRLEVSLGEIVEITGKRNTVAKVLPLYPEERGKAIVQIDGIIRHNAGAGIGDEVEIAKKSYQSAKELVLVPLEKIPEGLKPQHLARSLVNLPVIAGDQVRLSLASGSELDFIVKSTVPEGALVIQDMSTIKFERTPGEKGRRATGKSYEDIGGLHEEIQRVREMIELPLRYPQVFEYLGIEPPRGVLLLGPPGCGKTLVARAVANKSGVNFYSISGPEIIHKFYGESEAHLRSIFEKAATNSPAIVFIDEIDAISPKREAMDSSKQVEMRVVNTLLALMDGLQERGQVVVIGATNAPDLVDPALRRPGRFDREITIGVPDRNGRLEILEIHSRAMPLAQDVDIERLANITHGFTGADLAALCREAAMVCLREIFPDIDFEIGIIPDLMSLEVRMNHFQIALSRVEPSALREVLIETPSETWEDVGGLEEVKKKLQQAIEWPLKYPALFEVARIQPPGGIMLSGPPGCGKTLVAKAVANETEINFISIKGPQLMSMWVGESEKGVREVFKKARLSAPCIVFLDEIDAIAPSRGRGDSSGVSDRVVSQLLSEIDGIEELRGIVVLAATNRLDIVDSALLRPGRFDVILELPPPNRDARLEILEIHTRNKPLAEDVNLENLVQETEGLVGADIAGICKNAAMLAIEEYLESGRDSKNPTDFQIKKEHFEKVMGERKAPKDIDILEEDWEKPIQEEFQDCLKLFPELENQNIQLHIELSDGLAGAKARESGQPLVILSIPPKLRDKPKALRPILLHELSHYLDLENPDRVFVERADEKSKQLWQKLQQEGLLACEVVR